MRLGVIGGGAWGTALAQVAARDGLPVRFWARETAVVEAINQACENTPFLPGVPLSPLIAATGDLAAMQDCDALMLVVPAQYLRGILAAMPRVGLPLVLCAKGIEAGTAKLMAEVAGDVCPRAPIAVLSGPTFAREVALGLPTAVTIASADTALAGRLAHRLATPMFRPYVSDDVVGAEIGGAVKNVLAIACGVVDGAGLGQNARAALIARGFAEMTRFGLARGGRAETLTGLSGLGDLVLTCSSVASRNYSLGVELGQGRGAADILAGRTSVAEGASTAPVLAEAAAAMGVAMPVVDAVCSLLAGEPVRDAIERLLARPIAAEFG
ncbi:MAG: glycerol-3-phosphate dehydrogenase [Sphingomonas sp.]|nr:glycerol-3-phosphate dehydrogenase [Sphingomonas sp.]